MLSSDGTPKILYSKLDTDQRYHSHIPRESEVSLAQRDVNICPKQSEGPPQGIHSARYT